MHQPLIATLAMASLSLSLSAQKVDYSRAPTKAIGDVAVPGKIPGTRRYNVVFKAEARSFTLDAMREAIRGGRSADYVEALVVDYQERANKDRAGFQAAIRSLGGRVYHTFWLINAVSVEVPPHAVDVVRRMGGVLRVSPDLETYPLTPVAVPFIKVATDASHHNSDAENRRGNKGKGLGIAIVDTSQADNTNGNGKPHRTYYFNGDKTNKTGKGIDGSRLLANKQIGSQAANNSHPHGTGVASISAGADWGTAQADDGHAPESDLIGYSICNSAGSCGSSLATEGKAWEEVAKDKVRYNIISGNMSYGSSPNPLDVSQMAIDACASVADVLPVTAAGNSGSSTAGSSSTANGLAVGATANSKAMAGFSSRGPMSGDSQRFFPDIAANGVSTIMARNTSESGNYVASGTSMASPQVCGAAALLKGAKASLSAQQIKAILLASTEDISTQNPGRNRNSYGMGYLRDDLAANVARQTRSVLTCAIADTTKPNTHPLIVQKDQEYSVVITWYRMILTQRDWSDLNLRVMNGSTVVASSGTPRNLYEKVTFKAPATGTLMIEVSAKSIEKDISCIDYSVASNGQILGTCKQCPGKCSTGDADYKIYGTACRGTGKAHGGGVILPAAYATKMGEASQTFPHALHDVRYQQILLGSEAPRAETLNTLALRQDKFSQTSPQGQTKLKILLGYSTKNHNTLTTSFAGNYDSGTPTQVFNGNVVLPQLSGTNQSPSKFKILIPFTRPFSYQPQANRNLLLEVVNTGGTNLNHSVDNASAAGVTTSVAIAFKATDATAAAVLKNYGAVVCFGTPAATGAIPILSNSGLPKIGATYSVDLAQAVENSAALLFLGASNTKWGALNLPFSLAPFGAGGCSIHASGDVIVGAATSAQGTASLPLSVPLDNAFCGLKVYQQYVVVDTKANNLGVVTTQAGEAIYGSSR